MMDGCGWCKCCFLISAWTGTLLRLNCEFVTMHNVTVVGALAGHLEYKHTLYEGESTFEYSA